MEYIHDADLHFYLFKEMEVGDTEILGLLEIQEVWNCHTFYEIVETEILSVFNGR